jgi:hypothetical protein
MPAQSVSVGLVLVLVAIVFGALAWIVLRFIVPRQRPASIPASNPPQAAGLSTHNHAVLVVQSGGRIDYANAAVREWFELREGEQPNIELLARRIRPGEDFLKLCAAEGQARFSLNSRPLDGVSYQIPGAFPGLLVSLRRPELPAGLAAEGRGDARRFRSTRGSGQPRRPSWRTWNASSRRTCWRFRRGTRWRNC